MLVPALLAGAAAFAITAVLGVVAPSVLTNRAFWATSAVAGTAGAVALLADAHPTLLPPLDAVLRFAFVAGITYLARYSRRTPAAVSTVLVALAAIGSPAAWLAAIAVGVAAASYLLNIRTAWAKAVEGAAAALVLFHLHWRDPAPLAVAMSAVALAPLVFSGYRNLPRRARRRLRHTAFAATVVVGGFVLLGLLTAGVARPRLELGLAQTQKGLGAVRAGNQAEAVSHFDVARGAFERAQDTLEAWWATPARSVPIVAQQLRVLRGVAKSGRELSGTGAVTLSAGDIGFRVVGGQVPLDKLKAIRDPLARATTVMNHVSDRLHGVESPWLLPSLDHRLGRTLERVREAHDDVRVGSILATQLPSLLGADGPRTYFLAVQTPAEMRGSGGVIGNYAELGVDRGRVTLNRSGRNADLHEPAGGWRLNQSPDYLNRYSPFSPEEFFQNATASPDFPTAARVIQTLYQESAGPKVDGVLAIDPIGLAAILRATGPVKVPSWPDELTGDNAASILLYDQYRSFSRPDRIDFLDEVTDAAWRRLTSGSFSLARLAHSLAPAMSDKHLMLVSLHDDEQRALTALGTSGQVPPVRGDFLGVISQNAGGNKIDYFLRRSLRYEAAVDPKTHTVSAKLDVTLKNTAPSSGLPSYIIGNIADPPVPQGTNLMYVSIYSPLSARSAAVNDEQLLFEPQKEFDRWVYSFYVDVPPGSSITIHFDLAGQYPGAGAGTADAAGKAGKGTDVYHLDVLRQPTIAPDELSTRVSVPSGWSIGSNDHKQSTSSKLLLHRDESLTVGISRR